MASNRKRVLLLIALLVLTMIFLLFSGGPVENYPSPNDPFFEGHYGSQAPGSGARMKVISWNLGFADNVELAVRTLREVQSLQDADILLLQEMDEAGVDFIAKSLGYNYVYFPASIHAQHNKNFGNAILSRWPLNKPRKIVLPTIGRGNKHTRIAVRAETEAGGRNIILYSVHLETFWIWQAQDDRQVAFLAQQMGSDSTAVVGGDFNSLTRGSIAYLEELFGQLGFKRDSVESGHTFLLGPLKLTLDHIFSQGLSKTDAGIWRESAASDHYPLWAEYKLE